MNSLSILKGLTLIILSYIGITFTHPQGFLLIQIQEGSAGYYLLYALCSALMMVGLHKVYIFIKLKLRKRYRCARLNHLRRTKK